MKTSIRLWETLAATRTGIDLAQHSLKFQRYGRSELSEITQVQFLSWSQAQNRLDFNQLTKIDALI
jgi:hypothetical protein